MTKTYDIWNTLNKLQHLADTLEVAIDKFKAEMSIEQVECTNELFKRTIDSLNWELDVRTRKLLEEYNIKTLGQLVSYKEENFLKLPNVTLKTLKYLRERLREIELSFDMYVPTSITYIPNLT
jgi:DNA-directed RNA polymerase alpha subunit